MSYLSVICTHEELNQEDPFGFTPLLYYLFRDNFDMCAKLVFRGANVNHFYQMHGGKTAVALMVEHKNDQAVKFLLDKLANPHYVFGLENRDACDLARQNGLDKRFFVLSKCNGEHKLFPHGDTALVPVMDPRKEIVLATMDFKKILDEARQLDEKEPDMDWIHDELRDGLD